VLLFYAVFLISSYLALEPIVRRQHPEWLASWRRLLEGRFLDPLVGRDLMIGVAGGTGIVLMGAIHALFEHWPRGGDFEAAAVGGWRALGVVSRAVGSALTGSFILVLVLVLLQMATRRKTLGWILWWPLASLTMIASSTPISFMVGGLRAGVVAILLRFGGLLSVATALFVYAMANEEYLTSQLGAWYSGVAVAVLMTFVTLLMWGVIAATRTRRGIAAAA
jgi:hypothetical protein